MTEYVTTLLAERSLLVLPAALAAGALVGLNPCCLPLYPAAVGCCTALRRDTLSGNLGVAASFIAGGALVSAALGVASALAGRVFGSVAPWVTYVVAVVPLVFGLHLLGGLEIPMPRLSTPTRLPRHPVGAALVGGLLGLVIAPCATPVLAGLLAYVATTGDPFLGGGLLFVYGIGLGIPVLLLGTTASSLATRLATPRARRWSENGSGLLLVGVGLYLLWIA